MSGQCGYEMEEAHVDDEGGWVTERICNRPSVALVTDPLDGQQWRLCARHYGAAAKRVIELAGYDVELALVN